MRRLNQPYCRATRWNPAEDRMPETPLVGELRRTLGALLTLELVTRRAHWSVTGPSFQGLHELFDDVYKETAGWVDLVAERVRQLGESIEGIVPQQGPPPGPATGGPGRAQASRVAAALEDAIALASRAAVLAEQLHDQASVDVLAEVIRGAEKRLWFVRSHLEPAGLRFNKGETALCAFCVNAYPVEDLRRMRGSNEPICRPCYDEIAESVVTSDFDEDFDDTTLNPGHSFLSWIDNASGESDSELAETFAKHISGIALAMIKRARGGGRTPGQDQRDLLFKLTQTVVNKIKRRRHAAGRRVPRISAQAIFARAMELVAAEIDAARDTLDPGAGFSE